MTLRIKQFLNDFKTGTNKIDVQKKRVQRTLSIKGGLIECQK